MSRFLVGIDLGTTNTACAFVDTASREPSVRLFEIPQLVQPTTVERRAALPSFLYFGTDPEIESGALALPWDARPAAIAGVLARDRGAEAPSRQIASAKSWLAHRAVDRMAAILPWGVDSGPRLSPVDASSRILEHLREAWNASLGSANESARLERQTIVLTVPASFDEEARELTVEAARRAGLTHLTLLEEPIAAFYAWLASDDTTTLVDQNVALVCDVGGGTTDFSLIRVQLDRGRPTFERFATGEHLLLGGDNVDAALAAAVEQRMLAARPSKRFSIAERSALRRMCASAKEQMLSGGPVETRITLLGGGRAVIGDTMQAMLSRADVERTMDDFLPVTQPGAIAAARDRRIGLRELGLPFETDPAITRHLAGFLHRSALLPGAVAGDDVGGIAMVRPDLILFNGGFFTPDMARQRVLQALEGWFGGAPAVLPARHLESAVAFGAASYARLRAGVGAPLARIRAGSTRSYYIGIRGSEPQAGRVEAVAVLGIGAEQGSSEEIGHRFTVATNRPIAFSLFSSALRSDRPGDIVALTPGEDAYEHAPLVTVLRYGKRTRHIELPVRLSITFTEVGTLEIWCASEESDHRWRLQFELRGGTAAGADASESEASSGATHDGADVVIPEEDVAVAEEAIRSVFGGAGADVTSDHLVAWLEQRFGYARTAWPIPVIRRLADALLGVADGRRRSPALEARWLNLFGFCMRPGFGAAKDSWRIGEARTVYAAGLAFGNAVQNRAEWLVLWQRAGGGFSAGQQRELALRVMGDLGISGKRGPRLHPQVERESWRLAASLERLDRSLRVTIGDAVIARLRRDPANTSLLWAIGRLGARQPMYGPLSSVVPATDAARWVDALVATHGNTPELFASIVQIAALTGDPERDLDAEAIDRARARVASAAAEDTRPLFEVTARSSAQNDRVFGEPLPPALQLVAVDR